MTDYCLGLSYAIYKKKQKKTNSKEEKIIKSASNGEEEKVRFRGEERV